jgi:hypothetical protein
MKISEDQVNAWVDSAVPNANSAKTLSLDRHCDHCERYCPIHEGEQYDSENWYCFECIGEDD